MNVDSHICQAVLAEGMSDGSLNSLLSHPEVVVPICMMAMLVLIALAVTWRKVTQIQADAELKRSMIERGMSAEEIERVLKSKSPKTW